MRAASAEAHASEAEELDALVRRFEREEFIADDPIALPHAFDDRADREVIGLFAALLAWGRRTTALAKLGDLVERMRHRPAAFVSDFDPARDAGRLEGFRHRTFGQDDAIALTVALRETLRRFESLESLFAAGMTSPSRDIGSGIEYFSGTLLTSAPEARRLARHISRPSTGSACKRLAMYARWMVRPGPVDLGLWTRVRPDQLVLPLDVHTGRQARRMGLLTRPRDDWPAVLELTAACRRFNQSDPARYDFALFGSGIAGSGAAR